MSSSNRQQMFDKIFQWQKSGLSQRAWCDANGLTYSSFHYWYRRFRNQHPQNNMETEAGFVQLQVQDHISGTPWCELVLTKGQKICFHQPVPASLLKSLLD